MNLIFLFIAILVPIAMRMHLIDPPHDVWSIPTYRPEFDIFHWWKSRILIALTFLCIPQLSLNQFSDKFRMWFLIFALLLTLSTLFSDYPYLAVWGTPNFNEGFLVWVSYLLLIIIGSMITRKDMEVFLIMPVFAIAFFCALQVFSKNYFNLPIINRIIAGGDITLIKNTQFISTLGNPNHLALFCALLYPYFAAMKRPSKLLRLLLVVMGIGTRSRLFLISIVASTLFIIYRPGKKLLTFGSIALLLILFCIGHKYLGYHMYIFDRLAIYKYSVPMLLDSSVIGRGLGSYLIYFPQHTHIGGNVLIDRPHNLLIYIWHALGPLALIAFLGMLYYSWQLANKSQRAAIVGFMVATFFTDSMVGVSPLFFAILGNCWNTDNSQCNHLNPAASQSP